MKLERALLTAWVIVPFAVVVTAVALVAVGLVWGRGVAGTVASVGVPPLFAALLAWTLAESTRDREQRRQEQIRVDDLVYREADALRQLRRDNFLQLRQALKVAYTLGIDRGAMLAELHASQVAHPDDRAQWTAMPSLESRAALVDASSELVSCAIGTDDLELIQWAHQFNRLVLLFALSPWKHPPPQADPELLEGWYRLPPPPAEELVIGLHLTPAYQALLTIVTRQLAALYMPPRSSGQTVTASPIAGPPVPPAPVQWRRPLPCDIPGDNRRRGNGH